MLEHVGRCKAVALTFSRIVKAWSIQDLETMRTTISLIDTEEKSADNIEREIIREISKGSFPRELKEQLIAFVRKLDHSAGGAKRAAKNMGLIENFPLPDLFSHQVETASSVIIRIFEQLETALTHLNDQDKILSAINNVRSLENQIDSFYATLKKGYFEIEKSFNSSAALLILDHIARDIEDTADLAKESADILFQLTHTSP